MERLIDCEWDPKWIFVHGNALRLTCLEGAQTTLATNQYHWTIFGLGQLRHTCVSKLFVANGRANYANEFLVRSIFSHHVAQRYFRRPKQAHLDNDVKNDDIECTLRLPSAVRRTRLQPPQKFSVIEVMKPTVPLYPGTA